MTKRKIIKEDIWENRKKFNSIFRNINEEIVYLDKRGKIINVNDKIKDVFGYQPKEVIEKNFVKVGFFEPKNIPKAIKLFNDAIRNGVRYSVEIQCRHKNGNPIFVETRTNVVKEKNKKFYKSKKSKTIHFNW